MSRTKIDGLPIISSKKSLKLVVLDKDIKRATLKNPDSCAIAQACRRQEHIKEVRVHLSRVYLRANGHWVRYNTGEALRSEIIAFDRGGKFSPGAYLLRKVNKYQKRTAGKTQGSAARVRSGKRRRKAHIVTDVRTGPA